MRVMYFSRYENGKYLTQLVTFKGWTLYATLPNECCWLVPGTQEED